MSELIELNREEITRLSRMDDEEGHAWTLYLLLKRHMDIYTGIVAVDNLALSNVLKKKLVISNAKYLNNINYYLRTLIKQLLRVEIISDYLINNEIMSIKLPIAYSDTCIEDRSHH